ncbi:polycomb protein Asx [Fopius arisanus]|uniref:Asx_1 protein n=2 Tax=Fopius arisanus TaxID=64838 RepID=A0A0C9R7G7_9HYME|nr:PREDICTED: polycomb protein Asx [Fopius arisanus]XP_011310085.1 PREDICTED: polycomb protein Asx [Fopius arisanus]
MMDVEVEGKDRPGDINPGCSGYSGMVHSKKVIKHALRQQAKRRRKNTTIASGNSRALPQIVVKPLAPPPAPPPVIISPVTVNDPTASIQLNNVEEPAATMREVLASLPGFSLKSSRRRSTKKLSAAAQLEAGLVDLESPASILASTSLRALLNRHTFQGLPPLYQRKLAQLLPSVDRQDAATSGLNNEFFARACLEWRKRLAEGEFTPENQQRLKMEAERDKNKLDPWKLKHFEPIWGDKREPKVRLGINCINESRAASHGGAVTRSSLRLRLENPQEALTTPMATPKILFTRQTNPDKTETEIETETEVDVEEIPPEESKAPLPPPPSPQEHEETRVITESLPSPIVEVPAPEPTPETQEVVPEEENKDEEPETYEAPAVESPVLESMEIELREEVSEVSPKEVVPEDELEDQEHKEERQEEMEEQMLEIEEQISQEQVANSIPESTRVQFPQSEDPEIFSTMMATSPRKPEVPDVPVEVIEIPPECGTPILNDCHTLSMNLDVAEIALDSQEPFEEFSSPKPDKIFEIPECESAAAVESICDSGKTPEELIIEEHVINVQIKEGMPQGIAQTVVPDTEPIPEGMEIDSETLQRIHELEVRGEMREAYEEISGCTEEIIYPILEGMDMGSNGSEDADQVEQQNGVIEGEEIREAEINESNEDEELRDANNYVCSEMLDCSWSVDPPVNPGIDPAQDIQVPWPLVAAALDGSVAANITVTTQEDCSDTSTTTDSTTSVNPPQVVQQVQQIQQFSNESLSSSSSNEGVNCVALPVAQAAPFQEGMTLNAPVTSCLLKNVQQSSPIIAFPPLQSIRFVPRFQQSVNSRIQASQSNITRISTSAGIRPSGQVVQGHPQSAIVVQQHQNAISVPAVTQGRQIVANMQPQYTSPSVNPRSRSGGQVGYRGSRNGGKEQGGRSRSSTKEPPGAVNLERSYQICQAVIQSSPNRDQLKAHLKPPPSLLARGDGAFTTNKSGGRTITTVKSQKQQIPHKNANKGQTVMLRQVFTTTRQQPVEMIEGGPTTTVAQLGAVAGNGSTNFGQYILVQRTGVSDGAPRASSAPPLPPQIAGLGVGVHLVRGRPASAGEGSHQAVTLKARSGADGRGGGGAEPAAPGVIMGGDPPPPCECHMRGAMVICRQCGAFCHDDCMGPQRICATCLIR